jgi:peptidyl-tRNA hydrolase
MTDVGPVSGHEDPPGEAPWAMQIVVRAEKAALPTRTAAIEAAAIAAVQLLASPEAQPGGPWHAPVERWLSGRFRKIVRHARGSAWAKACELPGITASHRGAEVRAFVPGPMDAVPRELAKLQLQGLDLPDDRAIGDWAPEGSALGNRPSNGWALVIAMGPGVALSIGKSAAQAAHASTMAWLQMSADERQLWAANWPGLAVVFPETGAFARYERSAPVRVVDAGFTELSGPALTCVADWRRSCSA